MHWLSWISTMALAALATPNAIAQSGNAQPGAGDWVGPIEIRFEGPAIAGHPVTALLPSDGCVVNGGGEGAIDPALTVITRTDHSIVIDTYAADPLCFAVEPLGMWVYRQPLGTFAAGEYQLTVRFRYAEVGNGEPFATLTTPFSVSGGEATALDARSPWSLAALALVLVAFGAAARRRHAR